MQVQKKAFIITNPMPIANRSAEVTMSKFLRVIADCFSVIEVLGSNVTLESDLTNVELYSINVLHTKNKIKRFLDVILLQLKIFKYIMKTINKKNKVFFWLGDKMILPFIAARLKKAEIYYFVYGNVLKEGKKRLINILSSWLILFMANNANYVFIENRAVLNDWGGKIKNHTGVLHLYTEHVKLNSFEKRQSIIGMVCRIAEAKHVKECIVAFDRIHQDQPGWELEIIGSGKMSGECSMLIKELGAEKYIRMLGWVEHSKIISITERWKYLLLASDYEGLPNALIEMMGQGIPAIVHPVGGISEIVVNGQNGWLLKGTGVDDIEYGLRLVLKTDCYETIATNAYKAIRDEFTLEAAKKRAGNTLCSLELGE